MKNYCSYKDIAEQKVQVLQAAIQAKKTFQQDPASLLKIGKHKTIGLVFLNPSLRTRVSSQKAANNLGMQSIVINLHGDSWGIELDDEVIMTGKSGEHIKEAAAVLGSYCDILAVRSFAELKCYQDDKTERVLNGFIKYSGVPVVNLESALGHPLQALTDMMTIEELKPKNRKPKVVLSWAPHCKSLPQAVANSFANFALGFDMDLTICQPEGFELDEQFTTGAKISHNQKETFEDADFIYAKNWSSVKSYGKIADFDSYKDWQIDAEKMLLTNDAKFMHCLPVRRNLVVADEVLDSDSSVVIQQASNRVWAAQAVFAELLKGK